MGSREQHFLRFRKPSTEIMEPPANGGLAISAWTALALPAGAELRGVPVRSEGAPGVADRVFIPLKNTDDEIEYAEVFTTADGRPPTVTDFTNMQHAHTSAATGGELPDEALWKAVHRYDIREYGAEVDGDLDEGGTNDYAAVVAAVTAAKAAIDAGDITGAEIWFPKGVTKITPGSGENIAIYSNMHIRQAPGGILDMTSCPNNASRGIFVATGTEASSHTLSSNGTVGATTISCASATSYAQGDMVRIWSDGLFDPSQDAAKIGELNWVLYATGTTIYLRQPLRDTYTTADNAKIAKITPVQNVSCEGVHFYGKPGHNTLSNSRLHCFTVNQAENVWVRGCTFENAERGVFLSNVAMARVTDNAFRHFHTASQMYAVGVQNATQDVVIANNTMWDVRNPLSTNNTLAGGIPRRILVEGNVCVNPSGVSDGGDPTVIPDSGTFSTHSSCDEIWIIGNSVVGSTGNAVQMSGPNTMVVGNTFVDCAWAYSDTPVIHVHNETNRIGTALIADNYIRGGLSRGIMVAIGTPELVEGYRSITVSGNTILDVTSTSAISVAGSSLGSIEAVVISNNNVTGGSASAIALGTLSNAVVSGNYVAATTAGGYGLRLTDCTDVTLNGNLAKLPTSATGAGIFIEGSSTKILIGAGNKVVSPSPSSSRGVLLASDSSNVIIGIANDFSQCTTPVSASTGTGHQIATRTHQNADIASGAITLSDRNVRTVRIDTEADAATDDLDTISGGVDGQMITIRSENSTKDPTLKDGTGNLLLAGDFTLTNSSDTITLICDGTSWREVARADNA